MLKYIIVFFSCIVMLTACNSDFDKVESIQFNDTILRHNYQDDYGLATGLLNIYVVYGKYKLANKEVPAGIALTPQGYRKYSIKDLLAKYPDLISDESIEASRQQDFKMIKAR